MASVYLIHGLSRMNIPGQVANLDQQAGQFILPLRRERSYPRCMKPRPQKYSVKKSE